MPLSRICQNRLFRWKFVHALNHLDLDLATDREATLVRSLAEVLGNSYPSEGALADIVHAAVSTLLDLPEYEDSPDPGETPGNHRGVPPGELTKGQRIQGRGAHP